MAYKRLILGDANIVRFWQTSTSVLVAGVPMKAVSCLDTLESSLGTVSDELDFVALSFLTSLIIEEGSPSDVKGSCANIVEAAVKLVSASARKSARVEVCFCSLLSWIISK